MALTVIFVRHGESQANIDRVFANRPEFPGALTPPGIDQARSLAMALSTFGVTHIFTSPLARARQTAEIVSETLVIPFTLSDALREYDVGDFEGLPYSGAEHEWRWDRYLKIRDAWLDGDSDARHEGGESLTDMLERFLPFMDALVGWHDPGGVVVAVGHGGLYHHVLPHLFPGISRRFAVDHPLGHGDMVSGVHDGSGWRCTRWADQLIPFS